GKRPFLLRLVVAVGGPIGPEGGTGPRPTAPAGRPCGVSCRHIERSVGSYHRPSPFLLRDHVLAFRVRFGLPLAVKTRERRLSAEPIFNELTSFLRSERQSPEF